MMIPVDKNRPVPLYFQLQENIKEQIRRKELRPGSKIPTEQWYSETYGISRVTVRKALSELVAEGVLERERGKGPVVAKSQHINRQANRPTGLFEELSQSGITVTSKLLNILYKKPSPHIMKELGADTDEVIIEIHRVRYADGMPICLQICSLREKFCPGIDLKILETGSLYQTLEQQYHIRINYAKQIIGARLAMPKEIQLLEIKEKEPLIYVKRVSFLVDDVAVEYSDNFYIAQRYNLSMTLYL